MGKSKPRRGLSGLSPFVLNAFKQSTPSKSSISTESKKDDDDVLSESYPAKRQRTTPPTTTATSNVQGGEHGAVNTYDTKRLVPHYTDSSQLPPHLQKYFAQRFRLFSKYSTPPGCLLDEEGWYSVTPERVANQIAERCRCDTILDAFCGVGGNTIAFAQTCERVIAIDSSPIRLSLARHNAEIYGVAHRIEFILADYTSFALSYLHNHHNHHLDNSHQHRRHPIDVVFLSPPWGGPSYLSNTPNDEDTSNGSSTTTLGSSPSSYSLSSIRPIHGAELFHLTRRITHNVAYYLPKNTRLEEISELLGPPPPPTTGSDTEGREASVEMVEVEEEWMGSKLKALTCYFGGLATGQEDRF